jgi:hypothetical protein
MRFQYMYKVGALQSNFGTMTIRDGAQHRSFRDAEVLWGKLIVVLVLLVVICSGDIPSESVTQLRP